MQYAELKPDLPASIFPIQKPTAPEQEQLQHISSSATQQKTSKATNYRRASQAHLRLNVSRNEEFSDGEIDDQDLLDAGK